MIAKEVVNKCEEAVKEYISTSITLRALSAKYKIARSFLSDYLLAKGIDLEGLLIVFQVNTYVLKKCKCNDSNNYYIKFNKENSYKFLHYIYRDASIYLQRKYDKYMICRVTE